MRDVGVEEELLLVDPTSGRPRSLAAEVLRAAEARDARTPAPADEKGGSVGHEVQRTQVETDTPPEQRLDRLEEDLRAWRERVRVSALEAGARMLASGTSPLEDGSSLLRTPRYDAMKERFGVLLVEQLACGTHVHVDVDSDEEGVAVLDGIRPWLPVLLALSVNSPWWHGRDTAYSSYRHRVLVRWPVSGPTPRFGSADAYRQWLDRIERTDVLLDGGMIYSDARLSAHYPTVEVRVADVGLDVRDTLVTAGLARALVETAATASAAGEEGSHVETEVLRLANWRASRFGLDGDLLDPVTGKPRQAREVLDSLLEHVDDALGRLGDRDRLHREVAALLERGTGAQRQRELLDSLEPADAIAALARISAGED